MNCFKVCEARAFSGQKIPCKPATHACPTPTYLCTWQPPSLASPTHTITVKHTNTQSLRVPYNNLVVYLAAAPILAAFRLFYFGTYLPHLPRNSKEVMGWQVCGLCMFVCVGALLCCALCVSSRAAPLPHLPRDSREVMGWQVRL